MKSNTLLRILGVKRNPKGDTLIPQPEFKIKR